MTVIDKEVDSAIRYRDSLAALEIYRELSAKTMEAMIQSEYAPTDYDRGFVACTRITASCLYDRFQFDYQVTHWKLEDRRPTLPFSKKEYLIGCGLTLAVLEHVKLSQDFMDIDYDE
jgi:hypothetical protein